jgi:RNA polymerase sigma-70 factor (ECF subfamily)
MQKLSDNDLVRQAKRGDRAAFEQLAQRHYMTVYRAAFKWCGIREDAEDITQDVFVKVASKIGTFAGKSSFSTWLYRITMNTAMDFGRKRSTRKTHETPWGVEPGGMNPGSSGHAAVVAREILEAVDALPIRQKAAALLVWAEGFTHLEAAQILECAEATVSAHLFQARKKLSHLLKETS